MILISFPYFQDEQIRLGMIKVYSDRFCWKKSKNDEKLIVQMKMEDFSSASEPVIIITRTRMMMMMMLMIMMIMMIMIINNELQNITLLDTAHILRRVLSS